MAVNDGVPGIGVTPLVNGLPVGPSNPLPVGPGGFPAAVNAQQQVVVVGLAVGSNAIVPAVAGKRIFVTGYNFSIGAAATCAFTSNATIISAQGVGVVGGAENVGGEPYLFNTAAGEALNFSSTVAAAAGSVQVRYRVES